MHCFCSLANPFGFSQKHFGLKPFSFWEKPKGSNWKANGSEQGRKDTEQWDDGNTTNGDECKITCLDQQRTNRSKSIKNA